MRRLSQTEKSRVILSPGLHLFPGIYAWALGYRACCKRESQEDGDDNDQETQFTDIWPRLREVLAEW